MAAQQYIGHLYRALEDSFLEVYYVLTELSFKMPALVGSVLATAATLFGLARSGSIRDIDHVVLFMQGMPVTVKLPLGLPL